MNKKIFYGILGSVLLNGTVCKAESINLPQPDTSSELMKIIDARKSGRAYSNKPINNQELSNVLWAAFGTNSHGTRTIPTARNQQNLRVFVFYNNAVWEYDGKENVLNKYSDTDLMPYLDSQEFVKDAPVHIIYVGDKKYGEVHSGSAYENVSLYAAANGLSSVVRGLIDRDGLHKALDLSEDEVVTYHQTLAYPQE